ncbi:hypothetical protein EX895_000277 [Sporisorium graminicola]|uniref:Uncharacterized protein n=1 Tax=Sporisorium graminicola TaxID=280036 RepID=A0A4V6EUM0_9BASI|nr:hypothetical protein EX895_000277 [Sporisorium graminicola]TKY90279.1 hypothetical protein EX895_000277 [Sporisorium graminicola]
MSAVTKDIPIPEDAKRILFVLNKKNPSLGLPTNFIEENITFEGGDYPVQPGNLKSGAVQSALQAALGGVASQIAHLRYGGPMNKVKVNTDHAGFYLGHILLFSAGGKQAPEALSLAPAWEGDGLNTEISKAATSIYPTKDGRDFYLHGSLDAHPLVEGVIGLDWEDPAGKTRAGARKLIGDWVAKHTAQELEDIMISHRQCGSICYTPEEWSSSEMGNALAQRPLFDIRRHGEEVGAPAPAKTPFPSVAKKSGLRPLEGVKVLEMARVIAGPTVGTTLAQLGATVIKVNPPHLRDVSLFQFTLTTGVRTILSDVRKPEDRAQLEKLIGEADVFIDGYRPGSLFNKGYGEREVLRLVKKHRGEDASVVYLHECCYGVEGPYANRPGWQQIADAASGCCVVQGHSLGSDRAILPPLPISDVSTGVIGALEVLIALRERATKGGSYTCVSSLTRLNMFQLEPEVGLYSQEVVKKVQDEFGWGPMSGEHSVLELLAMISARWKKARPEQFDMETSPMFVKFEGSSTPYGTATVVAPVAQLDRNPSHWDFGPRPYGHDQPSFD